MVGVLPAFSFDAQYAEAERIVAEAERLDAVPAHQVCGEWLESQCYVACGGIGRRVEKLQGKLRGPSACVAVHDNDGMVVAALRYARYLQELMHGAREVIEYSLLREVGKGSPVGVDHQEVGEVCATPVGDSPERTVMKTARLTS